MDSLEISGETSGARLLCDEMLLRLGKWLRAAGYDTAIAGRGDPDEIVVELALREERLLLTCDKRLVARLETVAVERRPAWLLLPSSRARDAVPLLEEQLGLDMRFAPWSRCLKCNVLLEDVARVDVSAAWIAVAPADKDLFRCPACRHVFWEGSHVRRLDERLASLPRGPAATSAASAAGGPVGEPG